MVSAWEVSFLAELVILTVEEHPGVKALSVKLMQRGLRAWKDFTGNGIGKERKERPGGEWRREGGEEGGITGKQ
jgi:hypothetical protein